MEKLTPTRTIVRTIATNSKTTIVRRDTVTLANNVMDDVKDLIDDPRYKPFFFKRLYTVGPAKFMQLAHEARKGHTPGRLFVTLLRSC